MASADVVLAPTTKSVTHTRARSDATDAGACVATLPGITDAVFLMGLDADYEAIAQHCRDVLAQVEGADEIRVTSPQGTDITFEPAPASGASTPASSTRPGRCPTSPPARCSSAPKPPPALSSSTGR